MVLLPLYSTLPLKNQMEVFKPCEKGLRKVIVGKNYLKI